LRSFRRYLLDSLLEEYQHILKGNVLDIGGKKIGKKGEFAPLVSQVNSWKYLNTDRATEPDYIGPVEEIPLNDGDIDSIIITEVLEYIKNVDLAFQEMYRILSHNGKILCSVPLLHPIHGDYQDDRIRYTSVMLIEILNRNGFSVDIVRPMGSVGAVIYDILRVSSGYASTHFMSRIFGRILPVFFPLFLLIDKMTIKQSNFINTGYFIIATKTTL